MECPFCWKRIPNTGNEKALEGVVGCVPPACRQAGEHTVSIPKEVKIVFQGKKVIVIGERDGVPGPAIAKCLSAAGAEVVYMTTECFV